jgi:colanic acid biosynthesis glycosyl transferase WcaI
MESAERRIDRVLVASINFAPDHSGIALYSTDLPVFLVESGLQVTMVTGFPYYPTWRKRPEDVGRFFSAEDYRGVRVLRGYLYVPKTVTTAKRILHELSFNAFALANFVRAGRHDTIIIISPPLLLGLLGVAFKYIWRAQLVFHIQDLQPDAALSLGMVKPGPMIRALLAIERFVYAHSDLVATITEGMRERLIDKGVPEEKLGLYYNWIDVEEAAGTPRKKGAFRGAHSHGPNKFIVAYAGNIGIKQGVDVLVEVAAKLRDDSRFHFFIIGDGADKPRLMQVAAQQNLDNLSFVPFLSQQEYFDMLNDIDLSFVAQRAGTGNVFFPSKLLGIMAMGKPLLISADPESELARVIARTRSGLVARAGDVDSIVAHLRRVVDNPVELDEMRRNARTAVTEYDRSRVLGQLLQRLNGGVNRLRKASSVLRRVVGPQK